MRDLRSFFYRAGSITSKNKTQDIDIRINRFADNRIEVKEVSHNSLYWRELHFGMLWVKVAHGTHTKIEPAQSLFDLWGGRQQGDTLELSFILLDSENEYTHYAPNDIVLSNGLLFKPYIPVAIPLIGELDEAMKTSRLQNSFRKLSRPLQTPIEFDDDYVLREGDFVSSNSNLFKPIFDHLVNIYDILTDQDGTYLVLSDSDVTYDSTPSTTLRKIINPPHVILPRTSGVDWYYYIRSNTGRGDGNYDLPENILENIPVLIRQNKEVWLYIGGDDPLTNKIRLQDKSPTDTVLNILIETHPLTNLTSKVWYYRCHNPNYIIIVRHKFANEEITLNNSVIEIKGLPKFKEWRQLGWEAFNDEIFGIENREYTLTELTDPNIRQDRNEILYLEMGDSATEPVRLPVRCPLIFKKDNEDEPVNIAYQVPIDEPLSPTKKQKRKVESPRTGSSFVKLGHNPVI